MLFTKRSLVIALLFFCAACGSGGSEVTTVTPTPTPLLPDDDYSVSFEEPSTISLKNYGNPFTISQNNCGSRDPLVGEETRTISYSKTVSVGGEVEVAAGVDTEIPLVIQQSIEVSVAASLGVDTEQVFESSSSLTLQTPPNTKKTFNLQWKGEYAIGKLTITGSTDWLDGEGITQYETLRSLTLVQEGASEEPCNPEEQSQDGQESEEEATITPTPTAVATPTQTPEPGETSEQIESGDSMLVFDVNRTARSTSNSEVQVTWTNIELDTQTNTSIVRLLFENLSSQEAIIQIFLGDSYIGLENGERVFSTSIGPSSGRNQFGTLQVNVAGGTNYAAWIEFPELIDISQSLHLYIHSPFFSAEKFPTFENVSVAQP